MNIRLVTDLDIEECKKILKENTYDLFKFGSKGLYIKFGLNNSLQIRRNYNGKRIFNCSFLKEGERTILKGYFSTAKFSVIAPWIILMYINAMFFYDLISSFHNKKADKIPETIPSTVLLIISILVCISLIRNAKRRVYEEERNIIRDLKRLLSAQELG